jgi:tRNA (Thr-GGU) A37 N-methylase
MRVSVMNKDRVNCSECGREVYKNNVCVIDEKAVCITCMYGDTKPFEIYPIGRVRTQLEPHETGNLPTDPGKTSCIDLLPSQKRFMYKLEEETSLLIVYYLHKVKSVVKVFHRRLDGKEVGVFASRTPNRLSKIAVQDVKLLKIEGTKLYVEGLDAMEGSPVLDIKLGLNHRKVEE